RASPWGAFSLKTVLWLPVRGRPISLKPFARWPLPGHSFAWRRSEFPLPSAPRRPAAIGESAFDFGRQFNGFAGRLFAIGMKEIETDLIGLREALQDVIPVFLRGGVQLRRDDLADGLDAVPCLAHQQRIEAEVELDLQEAVEHHTQEDQVQKEPEQDLRVEWKANFHRLRVCPRRG